MNHATLRYLYSYNMLMDVTNHMLMYIRMFPYIVIYRTPMIFPWIFHLPSGKQTVCYWKWPSRNSWFTHEKWRFSIVFSMFTRPGISCTKVTSQGRLQGPDGSGAHGRAGWGSRVATQRAAKAQRWNHTHHGGAAEARHGFPSAAGPKVRRENEWNMLGIVLNEFL